MQSYEFLNLDHVVSAKRIYPVKGGTYVEVEFANGKTESISLFDFSEALHAKHIIIPSLPGYVFKYYSYQHSEEEYWYDQEVIGFEYNSQENIIGWRDQVDGPPVPVTVCRSYCSEDEDDCGGVYMILCPSGQVRSWRGDMYDDVDEWLRIMLLEEKMHHAAFKAKREKEKEATEEEANV